MQILPVNWGPIFGMEGVKDKIGDLSWLGPEWADKGWIELTAKDKALLRIDEEKEIARTALSLASLTVENKILWEQYLIDLDGVCLKANFENDSATLPLRPGD